MVRASDQIGAVTPEMLKYGQAFRAAKEKENDPI